METLPLASPPEVIRSKEVQAEYRARFVNKIIQCASELLGNRLGSKGMTIIKLIADAIFTFATVVKTARRFGEEYTYTVLYKQHHYQTQGVPLNRKFRLLLAIGELIQRHVLNKIGVYAVSGIQFGTVVEWLGQLSDGLLMTELWAYSSILQALLGINHARTIRAPKQSVSYKLEGSALLIICLVRLIGGLLKFWESRHPPPPNMIKCPSETTSTSVSVQSSGVICPLCYDEAAPIASTKCGHIFCWTCIARCLELKPQCPVCRLSCQPREIVQIR